MSKYNKLAQHLRSIREDSWVARFTDIEAVLGRELPASALQYQAWWSNQASHGHSQTAAWRDSGWRTTDLDLKTRTVTFRRIRGGSKPTPAPAARDEQGSTVADAKAALAKHFGVSPENIQITVKV